MSILTYPGRSGSQTRRLTHLGGIEEAAMYDLIFDNQPLRKIALRTNLSYQGVYIRALAYVKRWVNDGQLSMRDEYIKTLTELYGNTALDETNTGENHEAI